ncbi:major facilitator superfamily domain-containing protein [Dactylonectria macrodidyma]|uniref:Major facilitator superfamily domain-containing protein n=1 Tax=Dactylonectria macrodidyma TaxID=307937 RepID=A0A9P9FUH7_9HYPO|nr:major facilitator superfamily domain-containing protein [Dactylonectria macrodidyma]
MSIAGSREKEGPELDAIEDIGNNGSHNHGSGTVNLYQDGSVVLIPTPSPDPKDPLNLPLWRKYMVILLVGLYSAISVLGTSGMGAVYPEVLQLYPNDDPARVSDLLTYPTLFMGIGNLLSMPIAEAVGRRPVFLFSIVLLVASGIWCACSGHSLESHMAGRSIFSMAAGQSEALAPLMVQEIHFLHEHGTKLAYFVGVQTTVTASLFVATTYIVPAIGMHWWYGIMTIINGLILILSFFFVTESQFGRPQGATDGVVRLRLDKNGNVSREGTEDFIFQVTTRQEGFLQPEKFGPRTWRDDLRIFHFKPNWKATIIFYKETAQALALPTIMWMLLLNGAFLALYVYQASTFAVILSMPPYLFKSAWLGFVQLVQVLDCVIMVPLLGFGSDYLVKRLSRHRNGVFEPEYRLITLFVPAVAAIASCVIYGRAAASPQDWSWMAIVAPYHLGYFAFLGVNLIGITFAVDSFPSKAGPMLLVICAGRGFISFGLSYSTVPLIGSLGYDGAMNIYAIICGVLSGLGIPAYLVGKRVRLWAKRHYWPNDEDHTHA